MNITLINTMRIKMDQDILPWEFNILPFITLAESPKHFRVKFGWLWFYVVLLGKRS
jgi:hypothetical protein